MVVYKLSKSNKVLWLLMSILMILTGMALESQGLVSLMLEKASNKIGAAIDIDSWRQSFHIVGIQIFFTGLFGLYLLLRVFKRESLNGFGIKELKWVSFILATFFVGLYFYTLGRYSYNVPVGDDFDAILHFLVRWVEVPGLSDKLQLLTEQHVDHKIIFTRLFVLATWKLTGTVNFIFFIFSGTVALLLICLLLFKLLKVDKNKWLYFLPLPLLLFHFQYYELMFLPVGSITTPWFYLFVLLTFWILNKSSNLMFVLAVFLAIFCTWSSGNGQLILLVGLLLLVFQKRYWHAGFWLGTAVLNLIIYYSYNYHVRDSNFELTWNTIYYFFSFNGALFRFMGIQIAAIVGIIITIGFLYLTLKKYYQKNTVVYAMLLFLMMTGAAICFGRSNLGIDQAFATRYKIVSSLILMTLSMGMIELFYQRLKTKLFWILIPFALAFNMMSTFRYYHGVQVYTDLSKKTFNWPIDRNENDLFRSRPWVAVFVLDEAEEKGIYKIPDPPKK